MGAINSRHSQPDLASAGTNEVIHAGDETARRLLSPRTGENGFTGEGRLRSLCR
jgi:hypothetical protein